MEYGTGGLNIDGCRMGYRGDGDIVTRRRNNVTIGGSGVYMGGAANITTGGHVVGRYPPNAVFVHSPECELVGERRVRGSRIEKPCEEYDDASIFGSRGPDAARGIGDEKNMETVAVWWCVEGCPVLALDRQSGELGKSSGGRLRSGKTGATGVYGRDTPVELGDPGYGDTGTASRFFPQLGWEPGEIEAAFFYTAKASRSERERGLDALSSHSPGEMTGGRAEGSVGLDSPRAGADRTSGKRNFHTTVKPVAVGTWLTRLLAPPGVARILDPFCGSGTFGIAADRLGHDWDGIEIGPKYARLARERIRGDAPLLNLGADRA